MSVPATAVLTIELELGSEPLTGRITGEDGAATPFCGWLDLADALSRLAGQAGPAAPAGR